MHYNLYKCFILLLYCLSLSPHLIPSLHSVLYSRQVFGVGRVLEGGVRAGRHRHGEEYCQFYEADHRMNMPALSPLLLKHTHTRTHMQMDMQMLMPMLMPMLMLRLLCVSMIYVTM